MSLIPQFLTESTYGIPNWILLGISIIIFLFILKLLRDRRPKFKRKILKKSVASDIKEVLRFFSMKLSLVDHVKLRYGYLVVGNVKRMTLLNWVEKHKIMKSRRVTRTKKKIQTKHKGLFRRKTKTVIEKKLEVKEQRMGMKATEILQKLRGGSKKKIRIKITGKKFYLMEVYKNSVIGRVQYIFGFKPKYFLVDKSKVKESGDQFIIDLNASYSYYLGVFIFSKLTKDYVTDLAFKETFVDILEELINYVPKINYLEVALAGTISRLREKYKLEKEKYSSRTDEALRGESST